MFSRRVYIEAVVVGLILLAVATPVMALARRTDVPGRFYIATFVSGVLVHLLCEAGGLNSYYCHSGSACLDAAGAVPADVPAGAPIDGPAPAPA